MALIDRNGAPVAINDELIIGGVVLSDLGDNIAYVERHGIVFTVDMSKCQLSSTVATAGLPSLHASTHQFGGTDKINVGGLNGLLADAQTPLAHGHAQADITNLVTDLATIVNALASHIAADDPHAGYQLESEKGVANGYGSLDIAAKQPASESPALSGEVTKPAGSLVTTIAAAAVTYAKFQNLPTDTLFGRDASGSGAGTAISPTGGLGFTGSNTFGINAQGVTLAMLAHIATASFLGRITAGTGAVEVLTAAQSLTNLGISASAFGWLRPVSLNAGNTTTERTVTTTKTIAFYLGRADRTITSLKVVYRVSTAAAGVTWAEVAIAKGALVPNGAPTLTCVGFTSVASVVTATNIFVTTVTLTQPLGNGDDIWVLFGNQATTPMKLRSGSVIDDLWSGASVNATTRPSLNVGTGVAYANESDTAVWCLVG